MYTLKITFTPLMELNAKRAMMRALRILVPGISLRDARTIAESGSYDCPEDYRDRVYALLCMHTTEVVAEPFPPPAWIPPWGMVNPIRRGIDYQSIGRKTFLVSLLPE